MLIALPSSQQAADIGQAHTWWYWLGALGGMLNCLPRSPWGPPGMHVTRAEFSMSNISSLPACKDRKLNLGEMAGHTPGPSNLAGDSAWGGVNGSIQAIDDTVGRDTTFTGSRPYQRQAHGEGPGKTRAGSRCLSQARHVVPTWLRGSLLPATPLSSNTCSTPHPTHLTLEQDAFCSHRGTGLPCKNKPCAAPLDASGSPVTQKEGPHY